MRIQGYKGKKNIIANRLIEARKRAGLSQGELAAQLQIHEVVIDQQAISRIELNKRTVTDYEVAVLCAILKVSSGWLLGEIEERDEK